MKRRNFVKGLAAATALPVVGGGVAYAASTSSSSSSSSSSLVFDSTNYSTLTTTVTTSDGDVEVEYHFYKAITYCADPVNATYQSLNVSVPVTIAGKSVDATNAPILLSNSIGGYLSSSTASATGIGSSGGGGGAPTGGAPGASASTSASASAASGATSSATSASTSTSSSSETDWNNATLALAAGFVVIEPGARGRDLVDSSGDYYGVAPAAIVDLKAAVRYIRHNKGRIPGDVDRIISTGVSAGGALSTLLGASGDSPLYDSYLDAIGAAKASDAIFAVAAYCPITDLEHADGAYEYCWGTNDLSTGSEVDQTVSKALKTVRRVSELTQAARDRLRTAHREQLRRLSERHVHGAGGHHVPQRPVVLRARELPGLEHVHHLVGGQGEVHLVGVHDARGRPKEGRPGVRRLRPVRR